MASTPLERESRATISASYMGPRCDDHVTLSLSGPIASKLIRSTITEGIYIISSDKEFHVTIYNNSIFILPERSSLHPLGDRDTIDLLERQVVPDGHVGCNRGGASVLEALRRDAAARQRFMLGAEAAAGDDDVTTFLGH